MGMKGQILLNWLKYLMWRLKHGRRLQQFKDCHKGEGCFIIGNGPSLNKMELSLLKEYTTFGLNKIYLLFDKVDLSLKYHVAVNPLVIRQSAQEFESLQCPSFLAYRASQKVIHAHDHIYFLFTDGQMVFHQNIASRGVGEGYTVTYAAMQIAFYMGFQQVFLIGVDHNFVVSGSPNETQILHGEDQNHFDSRYFMNKEWQLPDLEGSELAYRMTRFHFERAGRHIYDATVGGKLQIFPKIPYEQALVMCKSQQL